MGNKASAPAVPASGGECKKSDKVGIKSGKKICCCCPETKKARDECVVFKGEGESSRRRRSLRSRVLVVWGGDWCVLLNLPIGVACVVPLLVALHHGPIKSN